MRPRFRAFRFAGGCSIVVVVGDAALSCLRFKDALDSAGVFVVPDDTVGEETDADEEEEPCDCCGIDLCCFCGELPADRGAFWGELMGGGGCNWELDEGLVTEDGALEYSVTDELFGNG